jgi:tetratricopeptide (TPR) repeat protein
MNGRQAVWLLALLLMGVALGGCDTEQDGVMVDVSALVRAYRENVDRQPTRAQMMKLIERLPAEQLNDLGVLYEREGRLDEAAWAYQRAISRDIRYAPAYINLGNVRRKQNRAAEARGHYRQAMVAAPGSFEAVNNFADLCATDAHDVEEAIARLEPMIGHAEAYRPYGLDTLGRLYCARGDHVKAVGLLETALAEAEGNDPVLRASIHKHLGETLRMLGRVAEAERHDEEAQRIAAASAPPARRPADNSTGSGAN